MLFRIGVQPSHESQDVLCRLFTCSEASYWQEWQNNTSNHQLLCSEDSCSSCSPIRCQDFTRIGQTRYGQGSTCKIPLSSYREKLNHKIWAKFESQFLHNCFAVYDGASLVYSPGPLPMDSSIRHTITYAPYSDCLSTLTDIV